jgi:predicted porin
MWHFGVSASSGPYLRAGAERSLPAGRGMGDYRQIVVGHDIAFAWHHLQLWSEVYAARFEIPGVGDADTVAYYAEAKYKFTPQFFGAVRWNQQLFGTIPDRGVAARWGHDVWRFDLAPGYRLTPHVQLKVQYSLQQGDSGSRRHTRTLASQVTVRF